MTKQELIDQFLLQTEGINEVDYGDFKRKVGAYLARLEEGLGRRNHDVELTCQEIKRIVVFNPRGSITEARAQIGVLARRLRDQM